MRNFDTVDLKTGTVKGSDEDKALAAQQLLASRIVLRRRLAQTALEFAGCSHGSMTHDFPRLLARPDKHNNNYSPPQRGILKERRLAPCCISARTMLAEVLAALGLTYAEPYEDDRPSSLQVRQARLSHPETVPMKPLPLSDYLPALIGPFTEDIPEILGESPAPELDEVEPEDKPPVRKKAPVTKAPAKKAAVTKAKKTPAKKAPVTKAPAKKAPAVKKLTRDRDLESAIRTALAQQTVDGKVSKRGVTLGDVAAGLGLTVVQAKARITPALEKGYVINDLHSPSKYKLRLAE